MRDAVLNMVVFQGDTEFASNEQQRFLVNNAPSEYDLASLVRIMVEETRHGYQMCHLLVESIRQRRQDRSAKNARAPRVRKEEPSAQRVQRRRNPLAGLLRLHQLHGSRRKVSADDAVAFGLRSVGRVDGADAQGRVVPHGHRHHGIAPDRQSRRHSRRHATEVSTTSGSPVRWICSEPIIRVRRSGRTRGASKAASTKTRPPTAVDKDHLNERARGAVLRRGRRQPSPA